MNIKLSDRLLAVSKYIPYNAVLADIGSDHAYLPIYVIQQGIASKAIAGEVAKGPFEAAQKSVREAGLEQAIEVRKGDGLEVIHRNEEVDCITIAGMGGALIKNILDAGKDKLANTKRLVLQPNVAAHFIRSWLVDQNWSLIDEEILEEDGHIYEILVAEKGNGRNIYKEYEKEIFFGPYLLNEKNDIFRKKWAREKNEWERIYEQLNQADENEIIREKKKSLEQYIQWYKEELGE